MEKDNSIKLESAEEYLAYLSAKCRILFRVVETTEDIKDSKDSFEKQAENDTSVD